MGSIVYTLYTDRVLRISKACFMPICIYMIFNVIGFHMCTTVTQLSGRLS